MKPRPPTPRPEPLKRTAEFPPAEAARPRPLVVVIDDDWETCDAFAETLVDGGFAAICLPNGQKGLEELERQPTPAAIILDLMMPVMDGWTFVKRVSALPHLADIPIIVTTAAGPHWGYPVSHVLRKPVSRDDLLAAVRSVARENDARASKP